MPAYLDLLSAFGESSDEGHKEIGARGLRMTSFQTRNATCRKVQSLASNGRSGRAYEMCYNLKVAARTDDSGNREWSVRQAAFYHQFDVEHGAALWISTKARLVDIKTAIERLTGPQGLPEDKRYSSVEDAFRSSLAVHIVYCHWALGDWRHYVQHLDDKIEDIVSVHAVVANGTDRII